MARLNNNSLVNGNLIWHEGNLDPSDVSGGGGGGYTAHIDDYGADPTGAAASDTALDSMIAAASAGDVLSLEHGTYRFDDYHDCPIPVIFDGTGGTIIANQYNGDPATYDQNSLYDTEQAVISFAGQQTATTTTTSVSQRETDEKITVTDASGFSVGDDILLRQAGGTVLSRLYQPTRTTIRAIDGSALYLSTALKYSYDSGAEVIKLDPVVGGRFRNLHFENGSPGNCLSSRYTRNTIYQNCTIDGYLQHAIQMWDDLNAVLIDPEVVNPLYRGGSHGEALRVVGSSDITMIRPLVKDARRGIDIRSGCKTLRIQYPNVTGASLHGFSYHNSGSEQVYGSVEIIGGQIASRSIDDTTLDASEAHTGYGVATSSNAGNIRLIGVTVEARRNALAGSGSNISASDCTFRSTYQTSTLYPTVDLPGTDISLTDCKIETYGSRGTALRASGTDIDVEGLRIERGFTAHGQWTQHLIDVDGAGRVSIDVKDADWASGSTTAVTIGTVDELTLSGDFDGPSGSEVTAIAADGAISNLMLDDIRSNLKIDLSGATSIGELWIGRVEAPSISYTTPTTLRDAYGIT